MRNQPLLYLLFFCVFTYGQKSNQLITGQLFFDKEPVTDVHIVNKNTNKGTISNDYGLYDISASLGDVLEFSHLNFMTEEITVTEEILAKQIYKITLKLKTYELDEIVLEKLKGTFYVDPEIVNDREAKFVKNITLSYTFHATDLPSEQASLASTVQTKVNKP